MGIAGGPIPPSAALRPMAFVERQQDEKVIRRLDTHGRRVEPGRVLKAVGHTMFDAFDRLNSEGLEGNPPLRAAAESTFLVNPRSLSRHGAPKLRRAHQSLRHWAEAPVSSLLKAGPLFLSPKK